jgi:hypothetical protein
MWHYRKPTDIISSKKLDRRHPGLAGEEAMLRPAAILGSHQRPADFLGSHCPHEPRKSPVYRPSNHRHVPCLQSFLPTQT